jgi:hypothetical protein
MQLGELIVEKFEEHIRQNCYTLTCSDVANMYFGFIKAVNHYGGNSENHTGLTEFLIFRLLWHLNINKIMSNDIRLVSKGSLGPRHPDIIVYNSTQKPLFSIQVKSNYYKVKEDYNRHLEVLEACPSVKIVTIAFEVRDLKHLKHTEKYKSLNNQYKCLILKGNNELIKDALNDLMLVFK